MLVCTVSSGRLNVMELNACADPEEIKFPGESEV